MSQVIEPSSDQDQALWGLVVAVSAARCKLDACTSRSLHGSLTRRELAGELLPKCRADLDRTDSAFQDAARALLNVSGVVSRVGRMIVVT